MDIELVAVAADQIADEQFNNYLYDGDEVSNIVHASIGDAFRSFATALRTVDE